MKADVLYPQGWDEAQASTERSDEGRDFTAARVLIKAAVPADGAPLSVEQLVQLVCGAYGDKRASDRAHAAKVAVDDDLATAVELVRSGKLAGKIISGPRACRSLHAHEVVQLVREVIEERRASWKAKPAAKLNPLGLVEVDG